MEAAGLEPQPLDLKTGSRTVRLDVMIDGRPVAVPPFLGVDRVRSLQAVVHTHDDSGTLWLEGKGVDSVTLGQLFTLWGVRLDDRCLGAACGQVIVRTDRTAPAADPRTLRLASVGQVTVTASS
jgi:hypothetical protein